MKKSSLTKIQYPFIIKVLDRLGIQRTYFNIIKAICPKLIADTNVNLKTLLLKSESRQVHPLFPYLFSIVLEVIARTTRQLWEMKGQAYQ